MIKKQTLYINEEQLSTKFAVENNIKRKGLYQIDVITETDTVNRVELLNAKPSVRQMEMYKSDLRTWMSEEDNSKIITEVDELKEGEEVIKESKPRSRKKRSH